jgi:dihydropyrimidine dehydrogenase (NAD+) subunit PreA
MTLNDYAIKNETDSCMLCHDAPCTAHCPNGLDPARIMRAYRFENAEGARMIVKENDCLTCDSKRCMAHCIKAKIDRPVDIAKVMVDLCHKKNETEEMNTKSPADLSITFCGVPCENPFFLSSSVVASNYDMVAKAFDMGWAGACFKTVGTFVPEEVSPRFSGIRKEGHSFIGFKNIEQISDHTLEENLAYFRALKRDYPSKIIIASILGQNEEEWTYLARVVTEAGADIIECNFSCPHMTGDGLGSDVGQDPQLVYKYTKATLAGTHLPVLAKMTPNVGNMEPPALAAMSAGATGIAAINTIKSIMNVDLNHFGSGPNVEGKSSVGGYSGKTVKPIALRFISDMKKHPDLTETPISGMGGIESWVDAAEFMTLGCANLQVTTAIMQYGYRIIDDLIEGMQHYLKTQGYSSVSEIVGKALPQIVPADTLNRHSIAYPKFNRHQCVGCGRCFISCDDGGHQALSMSDERQPKLIADKCVGCGLCTVVCPVGAISIGTRVNISQ